MQMFDRPRFTRQDGRNYSVVANKRNSVVAAMNWNEINKDIAEALSQKSEIEILIDNMSKFDIDKWVKPYNV